MSERRHDKRFPGEEEAFRQARNQLLDAELTLRQQVEEVARQRRELPLGPRLEEDYTLRDTAGRELRFSDLFADGKDTLFLYHWMYGKDWENSCPMCSSIISSLDGDAPHIQQRINLAVVATAPVAKLAAWSKAQHWHDVPLYSCGESTFAEDYHAAYWSEKWQTGLHPVGYVFVRRPEGIFLTWATEIQYLDLETQPRHMDQLWGLWNALDLTPEGRGEDWYPTPRAL